MIEMPQLVIFDCDGVLVDSEVLSGQILLAALRSVGVDLDFGHFARHFIGRSFPKVVEHIRVTRGIVFPDDFEQQYRSKLMAEFERALRPTPGLAAMLDALCCRCCVATSSTPARVSRSLQICGLAERFGKDVFTASQVKHGKPAPDLFELAALRMGVPPAQCLVVEDSLPGIEGGLAAGMTVWRYTGGAQFAAGAGCAAPTPPGVREFSNWEAFREMTPGLWQERIGCGS